MNAPPRLTVVVPCFNEEPVLRQTAKVLGAILAELARAGRIAGDSFVYFVDDGSRDRTWAVIRELHTEEGMRFKGLKLAQNAGHQNALLAGLLSVADTADVVVSMDADLQDDPQALAGLLAEYEAGNEIVYGVRGNRAADGPVYRATVGLFYRMMGWLGVHIIPHHADCRLASRRVLQHLQEFSEVNLFLRGLFPMLGPTSARVYYNRRSREAGESKYPVGKLFSLAWQGITSFSIAPLRIVLGLGLLLFGFSAFMIVWNLYHWARGQVLPGWTSTVLPIYILGSFQLIALGLLGEYLGKVYLETKRRPRYLKDEELN